MVPHPSDLEAAAKLLNDGSKVAMLVGAGALLGDRATMINSQNERVFMRSMATRGQAGGLSPALQQLSAIRALVDDPRSGHRLGLLVRRRLEIHQPVTRKRAQRSFIASRTLHDRAELKSTPTRGRILP